MSTSIKVNDQVVSGQLLVTFSINNSLFGVNITAVSTIVRLPRITALPVSHPFIIGITNLHGTIIPIIDLHKRFDFPPVEYRETARVVVVKSDEFMAGLIVDTMVGTVRLAGVDIEQFSSRLSSDKNDYIYGVGKHDHGIILLLSVPQLFCQQDVERLQSLLQRA